jgi:chromosome segregation ATPase
MSEDEKKAYDEKKKAQEDEEKRLKDRTDKEKQYLDDISGYWKQNEQSVTNSMSDIELKEKELGDDPNYVDKINLLNQKYQLQLSLLPEAEKQLNTYKNTTVSTADAQKELNEKIQSSLETVNKQKIAIVDAYNAIKKANEEAKKASEDTINATGEKLVEALKQEYEKKKTAELKSLKDEYDDDVKDLQDEIDKLQKKLDGLNDESTDNQTKLAKLKAERQLWLNETNNVFAKSKVTALDSQISDLEKTIQKDSLQKQIDDLNKQKSTREDSYNKQVQDTEDLYGDLEDEHKLYNKATELLTTKNTKRIKELLNSQDESFKEIGTKLGEALNDPIQQEVNDTITAIDNLIDKINELNEAKGEKSSSKSSSSKSSKGDKTETASNGVKVTTHSDGTKTYSNGDYTDSKGYYHTSGYATGTDDAQSGTATVAEDGFEILIGKQAKKLKGGETILNNSTSKEFLDALGTNSAEISRIDEVYDFIKSSGSILNNLGSYTNGMNYNYPNISQIADLNKIANNVTNNTDNSNNSPVQMSISIVNHNGAEAVMNEKSLEKAMTKIIQKSATKFGGKGFTNR